MAAVDGRGEPGLDDITEPPLRWSGSIRTSNGNKYLGYPTLSG